MIFAQTFNDPRMLLRHDIDRFGYKYNGDKEKNKKEKHKIQSSIRFLKN